jgi:hypothetical protein
MNLSKQKYISRGNHSKNVYNIKKSFWLKKYHSDGMRNGGMIELF